MEQREPRRSPLIRTKYTPSEIIGADNMHVLVKYLRISSNNSPETVATALKKEIGVEACDWSCKALEALRGHGYIPIRIDGEKIVWGISIKSKVQQLMESGLGEFSGKSKAELQQMARDGYIVVRKRQGGYDKRDAAPERWETEFEVI